MYGIALEMERAIDATNIKPDRASAVIADVRFYVREVSATVTKRSELYTEYKYFSDLYQVLKSTFI